MQAGFRPLLKKFAASFAHPDQLWISTRSYLSKNFYTVDFVIENRVVIWLARSGGDEAAIALSKR